MQTDTTAASAQRPRGVSRVRSGPQSFAGKVAAERAAMAERVRLANLKIATLLALAATEKKRANAAEARAARAEAEVRRLRGEEAV